MANKWKIWPIAIFTMTMHLNIPWAISPILLIYITNNYQYFQKIVST
jgi:hypothetical protein